MEKVEYVMAEFSSEAAMVPHFLGMVKIPIQFLRDIRDVSESLAGLSNCSQVVMMLKNKGISAEPVETVVRQNLTLRSGINAEIRGDRTMALKISGCQSDGLRIVYQSERFAVPTESALTFADQFFDRMVSDVVMERGRLQIGPLFLDIAAGLPTRVAEELEQELVCPS